jgi:tetratricopeptide (TPR) repeat protein
VQTLYPRRYGRYVLVELLGIGGMGEVALALTGHPGDFKRCVVKRLFPDCRGDAAVEERFRREGELVSRLSHSGVPQTLEVGECDGEQFIAQEFIDGRDLGQVMASCATTGTRMPVLLALHIVMKVADALAYVHEAGNLGVVHRDVSPSNVRLSWQGEVKLIDFGIARAAAQTGLTQMGQTVGRPKYMAPELLEGRAASRASDVYALGVVLWELLAGRPYLTEGKMRLVTDYNSDVSEDLALAVMVALNPVPSGRYATTAALLEALAKQVPADFSGTAALREFLADRWDVAREARLRETAIAEAAPLLAASSTLFPSSVPAPVQRRGRAVRLVGGSVLLAAAGFAGVWWLHRSDAGGIGSSVPTSWVRKDASATPPNVPDSAVVAADVQPALPVSVAPTSRRRLGLARSRAPERSLETKATQSYKSLLEDAEEAFRNGSVAQAIALAQRAAEVGGGARARIAAGGMLVHEGRLREAEAEFAAALRVAPDNAEAAAWLEKLRAKIP